MIKKKIKEHNMGVHVSVPIERFRSVINFPEFVSRPMYRWLLTVPSQGATLQAFYISQPSGITRRVSEIQTSFGGPSSWVMPRMEWDPLEFTILDSVGEYSSIEYFRDWMMSHTDSLTGRQGYASGYKRSIRLEKLEPTGQVRETWQLDGAFLTEMNHEIVNDREMSEMRIKIQFDNAINLL